MMSVSETARRLNIGIYDAPLKQAQPDLFIDLLSVNVAVFGSKQSGKTTFLQNILVRLHEIIDPEILSEEIYILDLNSTMGDYEKLPFVCCCIDDSNEEDVKTMFKTVEDLLKQNNELLKQARRNSIGQFLDDPPEQADKKPKHITLIIENLNAFLAEDRFTLYHDLLLNFCRDGNSKGLTVLFTANGTAGGVSRYMANMETIIAFNMPNDQAIDIFNEKPPQILHVPGRGIVKQEAKQETSLYEFQGFLPFESEKKELLPFIQAVTNKIPKEYIPTRLISFTKSLTVENFAENTYANIPYEEVAAKTEGIIVGLDYYRHEPVCILPHESRCIGIYGKKSYGKTNLLNLLTGNLLTRKEENIKRVIMFDDGRKQLDDLATFIQENHHIETTIFHDRNKFHHFIANLCNEFSKTTVQTPPSPQTPSVQSQSVSTTNGLETRSRAGGSRLTNAVMRSERPKQKISEQENPSISEEVSQPQTETISTSEKNGILFIIQSKTMYQEQKSAETLEEQLSILINDAEKYNLTFIFSDVKKHPVANMQAMISGFFNKAFLLYDIAEFVDGKGSNTVFSEFDAKDLKMEYAKCERGDGYYFDVDADILIKMKFLKCPFHISE